VPVGEAQAEDGLLERRHEPEAESARERLPRGIARASDGLLDFLVLAFAAWTVIYHVCLALDIGAAWAAGGGLAALVPCVWLVLHWSGPRMEAPTDEGAPSGSRRWIVILGIVNVLLAVGAAALFAFTALPWPVVWLVWVLAAGTAVVSTSVRSSDRDPEHRPAYVGWPTWPATLVALAWAAALGTLSLFLVRPDGDDTQYVHLSAWIAAHGEFPLRDTLFSDEVFPAIIFPPLSSFEALLGTAARTTGLAVPDLVYLAVPPLASALSVLATWRLLRIWGVRTIGVALTVAMVFLLLDAAGHRMLGNFFISRIWQGKVVFLAVLVPLLFVLLTEYVERPTRRSFLLLAAAGTAGVGLTSTGTFLVPVIAAGCLLPLFRRSPKQTAVGLLVTVAYPLAAAAGTLVVGARRAYDPTGEEIVPGRLVHFVLGDGVLALVAITAILVGPVLIRRTPAARMTAATVLLVACLFAPGIGQLIFQATGLAATQWRFTWVVPTAALVGVLATAVPARFRTPAVVRVVPAALLCAALALWGTPLWSPGRAAIVSAEPSWKRPPDEIAAARQILEHARPGDTVLAPENISRTILVLSGTVTTVSPRPFYTRALRGARGAHVRQRLLLASFAKAGLGARISESSHQTVEADEVIAALQVVGVDVACLAGGKPAAQRLLLAEGYVWASRTAELTCLHAPGSRSPDGGADR